MLFSNWDFKFTSDSAAASVFHEWELYISLFLHETKITSAVVRCAINYGSPVDQFTWVSI